MLNSRLFAISTFLIVIICVILSVTASPLSPGAIVKRTDSQKELQADAIPVTSDGDEGEPLEPYNHDEKVPKNVTEDGNSAEGGSEGL